MILPSNIRFVQRDTRLSSSLPLFHRIARNAREVCKHIKTQTSGDYINIIKLINEIVPDDFFGIKKHRKQFNKIVKLILTQSVNECIYVRQLVKHYALDRIPWLAVVLQTNTGSYTKLRAKRYLFEAHLWLLEKIIKPLILRYYCIIKKGQTYELEFVPRNVWINYQKKVINTLKSDGYITITCNQAVRGALQFRPKGGYQDHNQFRPIMVINDRSKYLEKLKKKDSNNINKLLRTAAVKMCLTKTGNFYEHWKNYVHVTKNEKIYGVKLDIQDAFGNIDIKFLGYILETQCNIGMIPVPIKQALVTSVENQFVSLGASKKGNRKIYQWHHGILQGDRFSSALCQLYLSYQDRIYLDSFCKVTNFLHRTVDDYLFCSTSEDDVKRFIRIMDSVHTLNIDKTESNLSEYHYEIPYCGQIINLATKEIKGLYNFKPYTQIRHRFRLWNLERPIISKQHDIAIQEFLRRPMLFFNNRYHFKSLELNTIFNKQRTVVLNFFEGMLLLAFKFDVVVMSVYEGIKNFSIVSQRVIKTVHKFSRKSIKTVNANKGQYSTSLISFELFLKVGFQAFILVMKKRKLYNKCSAITMLVQYMKRIHLRKSMQIIFDLQCLKLPKSFNNISIQRRLPQQKL